jgi:hypothetical protein
MVDLFDKWHGCGSRAIIVARARTVAEPVRSVNHHTRLHQLAAKQRKGLAGADHAELDTDLCGRVPALHPQVGVCVDDLVVQNLHRLPDVDLLGILHVHVGRLQRLHRGRLVVQRQ